MGRREKGKKRKGKRQSEGDAHPMMCRSGRLWGKVVNVEVV